MELQIILAAKDRIGQAVKRTRIKLAAGADSKSSSRAWPTPDLIRGPGTPLAGSRGAWSSFDGFGVSHGDMSYTKLHSRWCK
ncbi:MAG TPA: hypothetical protein HPP57_03915 [Deltaproteobacteria bacterium]|jgi:hypothetical protein|nr:hypothetical protein [Deltaproteobacteria bacterium]